MKVNACTLFLLYCKFTVVKYVKNDWNKSNLLQNFELIYFNNFKRKSITGRSQTQTKWVCNIMSITKLHLQVTFNISKSFDYSKRFNIMIIANFHIDDEPIKYSRWHLK